MTSVTINKENCVTATTNFHLENKSLMMRTKERGSDPEFLVTYKDFDATLRQCFSHSGVNCFMSLIYLADFLNL